MTKGSENYQESLLELIASLNIDKLQRKQAFAGSRLSQKLKVGCALVKLLH